MNENFLILNYYVFLISDDTLKLTKYNGKCIMNDKRLQNEQKTKKPKREKEVREIKVENSCLCKFVTENAGIPGKVLVCARMKRRDQFVYDCYM